MKYKYLLFDADGTLFDYYKAEAFALEKAFGFAEIRFQQKHIELYRKINRHIWLEFEKGEISSALLRVKRFDLLFEELGVSFDSGIFSAKYLEYLSLGSNLIDGTYEVIQALHGKYSMYIITNGIKEVQRSRFNRSSIKPFFKDIFISDEIGIAKPDPGIFDVVFEGMGSPPKEEVLIIGDSLTSDIQGGINYQMDTCWLNADHKKSPAGMEITFEINQLDQLLDILK